MLRLQGVKNQSSLRREILSYHEQVRENGACARSNGCYWYGGASLCGNDGYGNRDFVYVWDHFDLWNDGNDGHHRNDHGHNRRYHGHYADNRYNDRHYRHYRHNDRHYRYDYRCRNRYDNGD